MERAKSREGGRARERIDQTHLTTIFSSSHSILHPSSLHTALPSDSVFGSLHLVYEEEGFCLQEHEPSLNTSLSLERAQYEYPPPEPCRLRSDEEEWSSSDECDEE